MKLKTVKFFHVSLLKAFSIKITTLSNLFAVAGLPNLSENVIPCNNYIEYKTENYFFKQNLIKNKAVTRCANVLHFAVKRAFYKMVDYRNESNISKIRKVK